MKFLKTTNIWMERDKTWKIIFHVLISPNSCKRFSQNSHSEYFFTKLHFVGHNTTYFTTAYFVLKHKQLILTIYLLIFHFSFSIFIVSLSLFGFFAFFLSFLVPFNSLSLFHSAFACVLVYRIWTRWLYDVLVVMLCGHNVLFYHFKSTQL